MHYVIVFLGISSALINKSVISALSAVSILPDAPKVCSHRQRISRRIARGVFWSARVRGRSLRTARRSSRSDAVGGRYRHHCDTRTIYPAHLTDLSTEQRFDSIKNPIRTETAQHADQQCGTPTQSCAQLRQQIRKFKNVKEYQRQDNATG